MPRVVHFEIQAENPERAARFYRDLGGWDITRWQGPIEYWPIKTGPDDRPGINGGLLRRRGPLDGQAVIAYICTIDVPSVDEYVEKITKLGGTIAVPKAPIPGIGWLAYG